MKKQIFVALLIVTTFLSGTAQAQRFETQQMNQRLSQIERDLNLLRRQGSVVAPVGGGAAIGNAGQLGAEIARLDEEMRALRGQIEQANYNAEQAKQQLENMQKDMDFRLQEMETKLNAPRSETDLAPASSSDSSMSHLSREDLTQASKEAQEANLSEELKSVANGETAGGSLSIPKAGAPVNARDLYNQGFKQLNQTDYKGAESSFKQFTSKYSSDPLIGNAWYWLGEAYYVQRDYTKAADSFRQGYTKLPDGPKAGDNLLKLAMSLSAMDRSKESCVVLKQVDKKFSANSEAIRNKARQELTRLDCE